MARIEPLSRAELSQHEPILKLIEQNMGFVPSSLPTIAGCQYCQAHTATHAHHLGVDAAKIAEVWSFESDDRFTDAERSALRLARNAAQIPNLATDDHFAELAQHYDDTQIVQIVAVISLFGYLNRWNDTE